MDNLRDERGVVGTWLIKLLIGTAVVAVVLFEIASIAVNFLGLDSTADDAAIALSRLVSSAPNGAAPALRCTPRTLTGPPICEEAKKLADDADARLLLVEVDRSGVVHVRLRRAAKTLLVRRVDALDDWAIATVEGQAGST